MDILSEEKIGILESIECHLTKSIDPQPERQLKKPRRIIPDNLNT